MTISMNSLGLLLSNLGAKLGVKLVAIENPKGSSPYFEIRLAGLDPQTTFSFILSRSWKSTQIQFSPGLFAGPFVLYLCQQLLLNAAKVLNQIQNSQGEFSEIKLEIDDRQLSLIPYDLAKAPFLNFEVEVLTNTSSINFGLLNEQEEKLIVFAVTILISVLPITEYIFRSPDEVVGFPEGAVAQVLVNKYERDPRNRREAIRIHGKSCLVCGFNFKEKYGDLGNDYIVVHHLVPVSIIGENYQVDPSNDLATVCANCHAMLHRQDPPLAIEDLKSKLLG